ncbi:tRNA lysidine(34) synthetase TilS [Dorea sp. OM07-5]|uniref:tRNA(Ile)-lysidine synthase n=1 Tax=Dorea hominis TaxID=2763040 RepID=A0ABR7EUH4_9FIRM|nr:MULTISPECIES: tRNA lysidine(34) synthetase TilS [Dorea]MBC5664949.1 tRNA lysidine(34) synthetase TilS [Dorea hominis]RGF22081.1 tRNA lysidine(34) synthetase TilS [Dorea sp. AM10-31]RHO41231.1 tRNA lysidine(34) synthetase TilS [Dorea sp. AM13-35]RHU95140.1 tRNA lysidine(34) synthetase TilS [Dorea sp. OM07-5]
MYQKVKAYVKKWHMLQKEDSVIAGISGGADSVCLLFMLLKLQKELGFALMAVHVNHGIRGAEAERDEAYVKRLCRQWNVRLKVYRENVPAYAKEHGMTEEEAGRDIRRTCFCKVLKEWGGTKIALAHHENDNVETLLWNLCRGTGIRGLGGIAPVNDVWIRPLLCVKRREIESYLKKRGISYCTDTTNADRRYMRNRIRMDVIPYLEDCVNTESVSHMGKTMERMYELEQYILEEVGKYKESCTGWKNGRRIIRQTEYTKIPKALRDNVLHEILCETAGRRKDIEEVHIQMLRDLFTKQVGKRIDLPYGVTAIRTYEGVRFEKNIPEASYAGDENELFSIRVFDREPGNVTFPEKIYTKWFDYDIIKNTVKIRHRIAGDSIVINRYGGRKKLKQYFTDQKVPQEDRDKIWIAADGDEVLWIVGYRQSQKYQITEKTTKILEIQYYGGEENGRDN